MAELSRLSGVSVATIKFYLREGLVPEGVRSSPNQAQYDDSHLQRLRLIRALVGAGGLSLAAVRGVLHQIEEPTGPTIDLLGAAHRAVAPEVADDLDLDAALGLLRRWGWESCLEAVASGDRARNDGARPAADDAVAALASALDALTDAGFEIEPSTFDTYAQAMMDVAAAEIAGIPVASPSAAVRYVVLGTVLIEPVLLALRRLAQREASAARFPVSG